MKGPSLAAGAPKPSAASTELSSQRTSTPTWARARAAGGRNQPRTGCLRSCLGAHKGAHKGAYKGAIFTCMGKNSVDGRVEDREWRTTYSALGCSPRIARPTALHISMD